MTWARKADVVKLMKNLVSGSDTAKIAAEQLKHDEPYLLQFLGNKILIGPWELDTRPDSPLDHPQEQTLCHYTLNTGHSRQSPRHEVSNSVIAALKAVVASGYGPIPETPLYVQMAGEYRSAMFTIGRRLGAENVPLVECGFGLNAKDVQQWWDNLIDIHDSFSGKMPIPIASREPPRTTPLLAVYIMPTAMIYCDPKTAELLGDLERCIAWTCVELMASDLDKTTERPNHNGSQHE